MLNLNSKISLPGNKDFDFFRNNNLSNWTLKCFMQYYEDNKRNLPKFDVIFNQYKQRLNDINDFINDEDIKLYIQSLLEDIANDVQ